MSNNNDNLENKPEIRHVLSGDKLDPVVSANKIKRVLSGNKSKSVVSANKIKRVLSGLKLSNVSKANTTKKIISLGQRPENLPKIVGDIRHYPPANKE